MKKQYNMQICDLIYSKYKDNESKKSISRDLRIPISSVRTIIKRIESTGSLERKTGTGAKLKLQEKHTDEIKKMVKADPFVTCNKIEVVLSQKYNLFITAKTIGNYLKKLGYKSMRPLKKPHLTKKNIEKRKIFAKKQILFTEEEWDFVLFSDETKINFFGNDSPSKVWRKDKEKLKAKNILKTVKFNGGSIMLWGCFSSKGVGEIYFIEETMDKFVYLDILKKKLRKSADKLGLDSFIFQQDNDPKHTSLLIKEYLEKKQIQVLEWPSQSPDLNPIENLWAYLKKRLSNKKKSKEELKQEILKIWNEIPEEFCKKLVLSMKTRCKDLLEAKGKYIKY